MMRNIPQYGAEVLRLKTKEAKRTAAKKKRATRKNQAYKMLIKSMYTTSKQIMWILLINGILWIWCSYLLAFIGREQIAEALSSNVCTVIIGQVVSYFITKSVENVFKYNNFGGETKYTEQEEDMNNGSEADNGTDSGNSGVDPASID